MLALHPERDLLFVGRSMSAVSPPTRIGVVTRSDMSVEEIDVLFPRPHAIAVGPDGERVYTASLGVNQIAAVDASAETARVTSLPGGRTHTIVQFAVSPDGSTLVATAQLTALLLVFDLSDPDRPELVDEIPVAAQPWHPAFSPDGRFVYFGNKTADRITVVDMESRTVVASIQGEGIGEPHGAAVSADGRRVFVSNSHTGMAMDMGGAPMPAPPPAAAGQSHPGTVVVIDAAARRIVRVIEVGSGPTGVGTRPTS